MRYRKGESGNPARQFKPGQSGNPKGRPIKRPMTELYEKKLVEKLPDHLCQLMQLSPGSTWGEGLVQGTFLAGLKGKFPVATEVREAIEGKATARIEHVGTGENGEHRVNVSGKELVSQFKQLFGLAETTEKTPNRKRRHRRKPRSKKSAAALRVPAEVDQGQKPA